MAFSRDMLIERLKLELDLTRGLRLLILCIGMFLIVSYAAMTEAKSEGRLGLLQTYKSLFLLDEESLSAIKTPEAFAEYYKTVSKNSRYLMPTSSEYFVEEEGELKIYDGLTEKWTASVDLSVKVLNPKIYGSFTLVMHRICESSMHSRDRDKRYLMTRQRQDYLIYY